MMKLPYTLPSLLLQKFLCCFSLQLAKKPLLCLGSFPNLLCVVFLSVSHRSTHSSCHRQSSASVSETRPNTGSLGDALRMIKMEKTPLNHTVQECKKEMKTWCCDNSIQNNCYRNNQSSREWRQEISAGAKLFPQVQIKDGSHTATKSCEGRETCKVWGVAVSVGTRNIHSVVITTTNSVQETLNHSPQDLNQSQMITTGNKPSNVWGGAKAA